MYSNEILCKEWQECEYSHYIDHVLADPMFVGQVWLDYNNWESGYRGHLWYKLYAEHSKQLDSDHFKTEHEAEQWVKNKIQEIRSEVKKNML